MNGIGFNIRNVVKKSIAVKILLGGAAIIVLVVLIVFGWQQILEQLRNISWIYAIGALIATAGVLFSQAFRWKYILKCIDKTNTPTSYQCFNYVIMSRYASLIMPQVIGMSGGRIGMLKYNHNWSLPKSSLSLAIEIGIDLLFALLMLAGSLFYLFISQNLISCIAFFLAILIIYCIIMLKHGQNIFQYLLQCGKLIPFLGKYIKKKFPEFNSDNNVNIEPINFKTNLMLIVLTLIRFSFLVLRSYLIACAVSFNAGLLLFIVAIPIAQFAIIFSVLPEGLGLLEGGWFAVFVMQGFSKAQVAAFLLSHRILLTLIIVAIVAITYFADLIYNIGRKVNLRVNIIK